MIAHIVPASSPANTRSCTVGNTRPRTAAEPGLVLVESSVCVVALNLMMFPTSPKNRYVVEPGIQDPGDAEVSVGVIVKGDPIGWARDA